VKIILSRKGFDSSFGGCASPILEDGTLVSLPIPEPRAPATFADIQHRAASVGQLVADLARGRVTAATAAHLDPDLRPDALPRESGWRPLFGQTVAAQSHLANCGVGTGDLFLFFGWFREVERRDARFRYVSHAPDLHVLFGWLRVGAVWTGDKLQQAPRWAQSHPHVASDYGPTSTVYVAADDPPGQPDAGAFPRLVDELILTAPGETRRRWRLPAWFHPEGHGSALSYHGKPSRWQRAGGQVLLTTAGRGQEFVLDADDYPEAREWATRSIAAGASRRRPARASL